MDKDKLINEILKRWVSEINVKKDLEEKLKSWKKLRIKFWIDPSWYDLTLWHAVPLRKLKQFQDLWHQIVLLIWSFTARIWDPTWKSQTRTSLSKEQVLDNAKGYLKQAWKILDIKKVEVVYNWDWLEKMSFEDVLKLAANFTVWQMLHRDMFQDRIKSKQEINMVEFMYPLMQWYDSVPIKADVEIWWNDQLFNLMAWRVIQKAYKQSSQNIITVPILIWLDWKDKMSKSLWNFIAIFDSAKEMFGKTMSIPDSIILDYFELATDLPLSEIKDIKKQLDKWANPRDVKVILAKKIVELYHSKQDAQQAEVEFNNIFTKWWKPDNIDPVVIDMHLTSSLDIISALWLVESRWEAKRMIAQWWVKVDDVKISLDTKIKLKKWMLIQVWKRKWASVQFL